MAGTDVDRETTGPSSGLSDSLRSGSFSCEDLAEAALDRIQARDLALNAVVSVDAEV
jgi:Asp-tRNA(Asn)/Glu-tRNA(Gln) amidotransferase A subunit family amidase